MGGWLLGLYADRKGRRPALILAMVLMTVGSFTIGFAPGYTTLGVGGPLLLILARVAQGISTGGDSTNVYIYMSEIAPRGWRNRYAAFTYVFSGGAFLFASLLGLAGTSWLSPEQMGSYGWRAAFIIGGLVGVYGIYARLRLEETEEFEQVREASEAPELAILLDAPVIERHPLWATIRRHPAGVLRVFGFTMMLTLLYYTLTVSFATYATDNTGIDAQSVFLITTLGTVVFIALQYPFGALADRIGRRPQLIASAAVFVVGIVPLSNLISGNFWGLLVLFTVCMAAYAPMSSIAPVVYADLFPTSIRGTGLGTWYNVAVALFGGTVPLVLTGLSAMGHPEWFFWYIAFASAMGLASLWGMDFLRADRDLRSAEQPPVPAVASPRQ